MKKNISKLQPCVSHNYNSPLVGNAWGNTGVDTTFKPLTVTTDENGSGTTGKSGKWTDENTNTLINVGGGFLNSLLDLWKPADQNTTYVVGGGGSNNNQKDNTMLYVGIGGVVLVVILFAVIALKK